MSPDICDGLQQPALQRRIRVHESDRIHSGAVGQGKAVRRRPPVRAHAVLARQANLHRQEGGGAGGDGPRHQSERNRGKGNYFPSKCNTVRLGTFHKKYFPNGIFSL